VKPKALGASFGGAYTQSAVSQSLSTVTHIPGSLSSNFSTSDNRDAGGKAHCFLLKSVVLEQLEVIIYKMG
jgi:hypothetical protein